MDKISFNKYLFDGFTKAIILIPQDDKIAEKFYIYLDLLQNYSKIMNLTGIKTENEIIEKHFIESLFLISYIENQKRDNSEDNYTPMRILDIGTGAGFPGIPLKIALPNIFISLIEANKKKSYFLTQVRNTLKLEQVEILSERAEKIAHNTEYRESYNVVTSRAFGEMRLLLEMSIPFLKIGGIAVFLKGKEIKAEIDKSKNAIQKLGCELAEIKEYSLPYSNQKGNIIIIKKNSKTQSIYPRKIIKIGEFD